MFQNDDVVCCSVCDCYQNIKVARFSDVCVVYDVKTFIIEKNTSVYHTVNDNRALFHTSKTAKMIKVILLRPPCQNVNVLLSNTTFIIFAVFDV